MEYEKKINPKNNFKLKQHYAFWKHS